MALGGSSERPAGQGTGEPLSRGVRRRVALASLGCAKTLVDSENLLGALREQGWEVTTDAAEADALVVNTCAFVRPAVEESLDTILKLAAHKRSGRCRALVVAGCLAQRYGAELLREMPEVDAVVGTGDLARLPQILDECLRDRTQGGGAGFRAAAGAGCPQQIAAVGPPGGKVYDAGPGRRILTAAPYSAYLKIAEGCNHRCGFCIIPALRGRLHSRPLGDVEAEARWLAEQGTRELVIIAQDPASYGADLYGKPQIVPLLQRLSQIPGVEWVRVLYLYPGPQVDGIVDLMAREPRLVPYLDLPLQHSFGPLLASMHRPGDGRQYLQWLERWRQQVPDLVVRSTFIVGLPGEDEAAFADLLDFLQEARLDKVGVFRYSAEEGSDAAALPRQVPEAVKEERYRRAMALQAQIAAHVQQRWVGTVQPVLVEKVEEGRALGRTRGQAPEVDGVTSVVFEPGALDVQPGQILPVRITAAGSYDLEGKAVL